MTLPWCLPSTSCLRLLSENDPQFCPNDLNCSPFNDDDDKADADAVLLIGDIC